MKMEAVRSSEIPVNFYKTTRYHIPDDNTLHCHSHERPKYFRAYILLVTCYTKGMQLRD
jgi:hypothetical protein